MLQKLTCWNQRCQQHRSCFLSSPSFWFSCPPSPLFCSPEHCLPGCGDGQNACSSSILLLDSVFMNPSTLQNWYVIPKLTQHFYSHWRCEKCSEKFVTRSAHSQLRSTLPFCFSSHSVNKFSLSDQFNGTFFPFLTFCWWFCHLKWPPTRVLKCYVVFLRVRRLWCVLGRKCVYDKLHSDTNYSAIGHELSVNASTVYYISFL